MRYFICIERGAQGIAASLVPTSSLVPWPEDNDLAPSEDGALAKARARADGLTCRVA